MLALVRAGEPIMTIHIATIGFTGKSAEEFFTALQAANVKRVVDVRLNNVSQLAGFSKRQDLAYFLKAICGLDYVHLPGLLAPEAEMLKTYQTGKDWELYERRFLALMKQRQIEFNAPRDIIDGGCLLCSEHKPDHCHRRLVAEYLERRWPDVQITHLGV
jgi:uncharacterized protein (DUF488 family)